MSSDKKIKPGELPRQSDSNQQETTQQPEEFIDKNNISKDEGDQPLAPADSALPGNQERGGPVIE